MLAAKFLEVESGEGNEAAVFTQELATDLDGAGSFGAGAEEDGEEFFVGKCGGSERGHFFPRLLVGGKIVDALMFGHREEYSIF